MHRTLTWEAFDEAVAVGASDLGSIAWVRQNSCSGVYGIPRGGLFLAVALSYRMGLPLLRDPARRCIIVDDLFDTGESLRRALKTLGDDEAEAWTWVSQARNIERVGGRTFARLGGSLVRYRMAAEQGTTVTFPWEQKTASRTGMAAIAAAQIGNLEVRHG